MRATARVYDNCRLTFAAPLLARVTGLFVYPLKSARGVRVEASVFDKRGLQFDRLWMAVDERGAFLSQRRPVVRELGLRPHRRRVPPHFTERCDADVARTGRRSSH